MPLQLYLDATYVCFRGKYYRQTFGTTMVSLVSVTIANLVMEEIEQTALSSFHPPPWFWKRYVDDTCTVLPRGLVEGFHQHLNSISEHIQFTVEEEKYGCLPFRDILLTRDVDGSIHTCQSFAKRPTLTGILTSHPITPLIEEVCSSNTTQTCQGPLVQCCQLVKGGGSCYVGTGKEWLPKVLHTTISPASLPTRRSRQ